MKKVVAVVGVALATLIAAPAKASALAVVDAFLFSDWTAPTNVSSPPFTFTPIDGVRLTLNGSGWRPPRQMSEQKAPSPSFQR